MHQQHERHILQYGGPLRPAVAALKGPRYIDGGQHRRFDPDAVSALGLDDVRRDCGKRRALTLDGDYRAGPPCGPRYAYEGTGENVDEVDRVETLGPLIDVRLGGR